MTLFTFSLRNIRRKTIRSAAIVITAALASGLIFYATVLLHAAGRSLELGMERLGADIMVVPEGYEDKGRKVLLAGEPTSFYMDVKNLEIIAHVEGVAQTSAQLFMTSSVLECCSMPTVLLVGFDPNTDFTITPWLRYIHTVSKKELDEVTIGAETLYASEGPHMTFFGKEFKIGSSLEPTGLGFLDYSIFMTMDAARDMIAKSGTASGAPQHIRPDQISSMLVKVDPKHEVRKVAGDVEKSLPGVKTIVTRDFITSVRKDAAVALWGVMAAGAAFWVAMLVFMGLIYAMTVNERQRELGILRAMGANKRHVFRLILLEATILTALGSVLGVGIGWGVIYSFKAMIINTLGGIQFLWPPSSVIVAIGLGCVGFMLLSGALSAMYPAIKISTREPYDAIHQGM